jgi:hypothetical protein
MQDIRVEMSGMKGQQQRLEDANGKVNSVSRETAKS